jgi:hypothetical protein
VNELRLFGENPACDARRPAAAFAAGDFEGAMRELRESGFGGEREDYYEKRKYEKSMYVEKGRRCAASPAWGRGLR